MAATDGVFGIGKGDAQVFGANQGLKYLQGIIQDNQLKRAKEQKDLQDSLSQVKADGLREPDLPDFYKKYDNIKSIYSQILSEKDPYKKAQLNNDFEKAKIDAMSFAKKSNETGKMYTDFKSKALDNKFRDQFQDDAIEKAQKSDKLAMSHPDFISDFSTLGRQLDFSHELDKLGKIDDDAIKGSQAKNPIMTPTMIGNKPATLMKYVKEVDPVHQAALYKLHYDTDRNTKAWIQQQYKDLYDKYPEDEATDMAMKDLVSKRPLRKEDIKTEDDWRPRAPRAGGSAGLAGNPQDIILPYAQGKASTLARDYVPVSIPNKNFAGSPAWDLNTGKQIPSLQSSSDYEVVGVGNFPIIKGGHTNTGESVANALSQPNFAKNNPNSIQYKAGVHVQKKDPLTGTTDDFVIPYERFPDNVKNTKAVREAIAKFRPAQQQPIQKPVAKKNKPKDPLGIF